MSKNQKLYPFKFEAAGLDENSVVANGFLSENTIDDIIETYLGEIAGNDNFQYYKGIFPIKISFNSIVKELPPQAHPDNLTAAERYMSLGKSKLWYITKSSPKTTMYLGFKEEMDATKFYNGCLDGTLEESLHSFHPVKGDYIYIKPGCIHAVKGALEFIEVSQNSDATYHFTGEDASIEIAESIDIIDYSKVDEAACRLSKPDEGASVANSSGFIIRLVKPGKSEFETAPQESFIAYLCLNGSATVEHDGKSYEFGKDEIILIPAAMDSFRFIANGSTSEFLEITLPKVSELEEDLYMNYYEDESNYPTGSGTDPEEEEDEDEDHHCDCGHGHHDCDHDHCDCGHDHDDDGRHPGEFFFRR